MADTPDAASGHFQPDGRPVDEQLAELRVQIDSVDQELLSLLNQRARLAQAVGEVKKIDGSPVFRPDREVQVIEGLKQANPGPVLADSIGPIWREIMSACRALEARQRVAFLGPVGTFSEQAALRYFGSSIDAIACANIDEVFRATVSGSADFGVVPVENNKNVLKRAAPAFARLAWYRSECGSMKLLSASRLWPKSGDSLQH